MTPDWVWDIKKRLDSIEKKLDILTKKKPPYLLNISRPESMMMTLEEWEAQKQLRKGKR